MRRLLCASGLLGLALAAGCGTNFNEAFLLAAESGTRTLLDVFLSDLISDLPELFTLPPGPGEPVADDQAGGDMTGGDTGGTDTGDAGGTDTGDAGGTGPIGDPAAGRVLFTDNSCVLCHCEDASGGCLAGAPNLQGKDFATVAERLQGETPHPGGKFPELIDQDLADIVAFLADAGGP